MDQYKTFKRKAIASSISSILLASASATPILAQDEVSTTSPSQMEEIVVKGIRSSLTRAMDIKRDSAGVVDAISAEDIGKFPDSNLAESLQRISGVSIDRVNGEGSEITVRGFGSEFNMVTLNGRTMPGGGVFGGENLGAQESSTRAFDFANLASEGVAGVEVYKTGRATIATGGIGATVNIKTARPLDTQGFKLSTGIKAVNDTTNERGSDYTPELSGLVSWSDEESKFGAGLSLSHQERHSGIRGLFNNTWRIDRAGPGGDISSLYSLAPGAVVENAPEEGQLFARSNDIRYTFADRERTRTNGQLTFQFAPSENITATADYTYARNELFERRGSSTSWFNNSNITNVIFDDSAVATPVLISEISGTRDHAYQQGVRQQENTLESLGLNVEWQASDRLSFNFDAHDSSMDSLPSGPSDNGTPTSEVLVSIGLVNQVGQTIDYRSGVPITTVPLDDSTKGTPNGQIDVGDLGSQIGRVYYREQLNDATEVRIGGSYEFDDESRFNFGVERREMKMTENSSRRQMTLGNWGQNFPGDVPAELVEEFNYTDFDDIDVSAGFGAGYRGNAEDILASLVTTYGTADNGYCVCIDPDFSVSDDIEETTTGVYGELDLSGSMGDMPFSVLFGLRYEKTEQTSTSRQLVLENLIWEDNNDFILDFSSTIQDVVDDNNYSNLLPSVDFDVSVTDDVLVRASYSKTIARTTYNNLKSSVSGFGGGGGSVLLGSQPEAQSGNPFLQPLESDNVDLSVEWYYDDSSYVSIGYFRKDVKNFVGTETVNRNVFGLRDATSGPRVQAALQALIDGGFAVNDTSLHAMTVLIDTGRPVTDFQADENFQIALGASDDNIVPNSDDPLIDFSVTQPVNTADAEIDGIEFAIQHFFGDTGFGIAANYTVVNGDIGFDVTADPGSPQFALLGLSDTANLVGIYEKGAWQARLAYNWRDEFLDQTNNTSFNNPVFVEAYTQIDLSVNYEVNEKLNVFVEGLNLTGEDRRDFGRNSGQIETFEDLGARYHVGARYTF